MALEVIRTAPQLDAYIPLSEHQAQTPGTFFGGKAVLYYHNSNATLSIDSQQLEASPAFSALCKDNDASAGAVNGSANGASSQQSTIVGLDIWVTSE